MSYGPKFYIRFVDLRRRLIDNVEKGPVFVFPEYDFESVARSYSGLDVYVPTPPPEGKATYGTNFIVYDRFPCDVEFSFVEISSDEPYLHFEQFWRKAKKRFPFGFVIEDQLYNAKVKARATYDFGTHDFILLDDADDNTGYEQAKKWNRFVFRYLTEFLKPYKLLVLEYFKKTFKSSGISQTHYYFGGVVAEPGDDEQSRLEVPDALALIQYSHFTPKQFGTILELLMSGHSQYEACRLAKVNWFHFLHALRASPDLRALVQDAELAAVSQVENALFQSAVRGNVQAAIFWLKNRAPERWSERADMIRGKIQVDHRHTIEIPQDEERMARVIDALKEANAIPAEFRELIGDEAEN